MTDGLGDGNALSAYDVPTDVASAYEALYRTHGTLPREADELFIWEVAVLLGVHRQDDDTGRPTARASRADKRRLLRERVAHARGQGPPPEPRPVDPDQLNAMSAHLGTT